ncbi:bacteriophage tail protein GpU [Escherichia coli]|nr:bacteriophage tail protein GpU [Escherichia coli]
MMMMVLGLYVFMLRTVPYQELQYQRSWRHAANSRVNRRPSTQFLGPDNDMLTLSGVLMPEITGGQAVVAGTGADGRTGESMAPD